MDAIVDSATVPGFATVAASSLEKGDRVADVYGGTHVVARVTHRRDGSTRIVREDGWVDVFERDDLVTVPTTLERGRFA